MRSADPLAGRGRCSIAWTVRTVPPRSGSTPQNATKSCSPIRPAAAARAQVEVERPVDVVREAALDAPRASAG